MVHFFLDIIFPRVCGFCSKLCKDYVCDSCREKIKKYMFSKKKMYISKSFDYHYYLFSYQDVIRKGLIQYKFHEKSYLADTFWKLLVSDEKIGRFLQNHDIIIPVPLHKKRKLQRGYNQSELIAKKLARGAGIKFVSGSLYKKKNTIAQSKLNKHERYGNAKDVYEIRNIERIKDKKIILFDDIYTTGATINECSKILMQNGSKQVDVLTIAKD